MKDYHKCSKEEGFCPTLEMVTQPAANGEPKGLSFYAVFDMKMLDRKSVSLDESVSVIGVVYRTKAGDRGVMLNHCPFCGEDLRQFRKDHVKEKQG